MRFLEKCMRGSEGGVWVDVVRVRVDGDRIEGVFGCSGRGGVWE